MNDTAIEWADDTVNGWWGCQKVSPACAHCYAETLDARFHPDRYTVTQAGTYVEKGGHWGANAQRKLRVDNAIRDLERIARRSDREGRPRRVFMHSMSDFFEDRADLVEPRKRLWDALHRLCGATSVGSVEANDCDACGCGERRDCYPCHQCGRGERFACYPMGPRLIPMLLTKRPAVMAAWAKEHGWPAGAWAGTTAENQATADERIPHLLRVPARVRFLSCEPLLGPVSLRELPSRMRTEDYPQGALRPLLRLDALTGEHRCGPGGFSMDYDDPQTDDGGPTRRIHWVIAGGESGPKARPTHPDWLRSLRDQCQSAGVPFFFKQWGMWAPIDDIESGGNSWQGMTEACAEDGGGLERHHWPDSPVRESARRLGKHDVAATPYAIAGDTEVLWVGKAVAGRHLDGVVHDDLPNDYMVGGTS